MVTAFQRSVPGTGPVRFLRTPGSWETQRLFPECLRVGGGEVLPEAERPEWIGLPGLQGLEGWHSSLAVPLGGMCLVVEALGPLPTLSKKGKTPKTAPKPSDRLPG